MTLLEAIQQRHSIRSYTTEPIQGNTLQQLQTKITECNTQGDLHIQLVLNEPKAFSAGLMQYGKFSGVQNYIAMIGKKSDSLWERLGYYGEQIVLLAQQLGLSTCWVGLTYTKTKEAFTLAKDEQLVCVIAIGYAAAEGKEHKIKTFEEVVEALDTPTLPQWFHEAVEAALLAPTGLNQQKFKFRLIEDTPTEACVAARTTFALNKYPALDLGIVKYHFEIGANKTIHWQ